ncbi:MAG: hypothetical protein COW63_08215 [Bacteroidetes bacterium CG18_big_fil_WC_8_21_14_2_50_41_14]|nr:MAG: hypothetical protein COW63_08215 [Bacteroidetes bacterium CG18_big_fil_WC_8_21_14_2_50_41_14]PJB57879.1 MAG: hypothetical protein CO098_10610 [Bacteroidetes bacterium CG_4_9_14_3_um_filter_41_19]
MSNATLPVKATAVIRFKKLFFFIFVVTLIGYFILFLFLFFCTLHNNMSMVLRMDEHRLYSGLKMKHKNVLVKLKIK